MLSQLEPARRERFIIRWIAHHEMQRVIGTMRGGLALHLGYLIVIAVIAKPTATSLVLAAASAGALLADVLGLLAMRRGDSGKARAACAFANVWSTAGQLLGCFLNRIDIARGDTSTAVHICAMAMIGVIIVTTTFKGAKLRALAALAVALFLPSAFVRSPYFMCEAWVFLMPLTLAAATRMRMVQCVAERAEASAAYDRMAQIAPPAIVEHVSQSHVSVDEAFKPIDRACVCLCSDWRDYQSMTAGMQSAAVVEALEIYYAATDALLEECFPRGNYFSDWIADELFIVAFSLAEGDEAETAREAVAFAERLVAARARIAAKTGVPRAIDVGLAAGMASVGLMGPPRHRKATALGETPGRSRRLQTAAKLLRQHRGPQDRVIVDPGLAALLAGEKDFKRWALPEGQALRDVSDRELVYLEPESEPRHLAA